MNHTSLITWVMTTLATMAPGVQAAQPYPSSTAISGMQWDFSKHVRRAESSDNWAITWAADDHQYTSWGDGMGFDGGVTKISLGFSRVQGSKDSWTARDTYGSENAESFATVGGKSYAILAIGNTLYSFVSPGSDVTNLTVSTLYKSTDGGHSWSRAPVEFTQATHALSLPCFLQFGKGYAGARDGYVYTYWTKVQALAWEVQKPGEIMLTRVPTSSIESQSQYEYFTGLDGSGVPRWSTTRASAVPVFRDPNGVMRNSIIYNPGLQRYLLVTNHTARNQGNVAVFDAPQPWGPWTTVAYYSGWPAGGEIAKNTFYGNFSAKWMSANGRDFVFVFTGKESNDSWNSVHGTFLVGSQDLSAPSTVTDLRSRP